MVSGVSVQVSAPPLAASVQSKLIVSDMLIRRFVVVHVHVLILEAFETLSISRTSTSTTTRTILMPYFGFKSKKFHTSTALYGRGRPVKSNEKLMNVEHRTSNIEHRIMFSVYFKKRASDLSGRSRRRSLKRHPAFVIRQSIFVIPCSFIRGLSTSVA
jgi:hypothetical protein